MAQGTYKEWTKESCLRRRQSKTFRKYAFWSCSLGEIVTRGSYIFDDCSDPRRRVRCEILSIRPGEQRCDLMHILCRAEVAETLGAQDGHVGV